MGKVHVAQIHQSCRRSYPIGAAGAWILLDLMLPGHRWHNWAWRPAGIRAQLFPTDTFQSVSVDARLRLA